MAFLSSGFFYDNNWQRIHRDISYIQLCQSAIKAMKHLQSQVVPMAQYCDGMKVH